jgi:hypothetical protein
MRFGEHTTTLVVPQFTSTSPLSMACATPQLSPIRVPFHKRDSSISPGGSLCQLLVQWRQGEKAGRLRRRRRRQSDWQSHRGCESSPRLEKINDTSSPARPRHLIMYNAAILVTKNRHLRPRLSFSCPCFAPRPGSRTFPLPATGISMGHVYYMRIQTCSGPVASSADLSSRILTKRGNLSEIPLSSTCCAVSEGKYGEKTLTSPCAAVYTGLKLRSAVNTSQTIWGSNQTSGFAPPTLISPRTLVSSKGLRTS